MQVQHALLKQQASPRRRSSHFIYVFLMRFVIPGDQNSSLMCHIQMWECIISSLQTTAADHPSVVGSDLLVFEYSLEEELFKA